MLTTIKSLFGEFQQVETEQLKEFTNLLEHPPAPRNERLAQLSPNVLPSLFKRHESLIDIDDVEEANLSEYEVGGTLQKNECGRYSDLRASVSGNGSGRERQRSNSDNLTTSPVKIRGSNKSTPKKDDAVKDGDVKDAFSDRVRNKDKGSLRYNN